MNSKHNRLFMLAVLLMTIILLSLFIGTNLFAKPNNSNKPENPGKPEEPPLEEDGTDFKIWIGTGNPFSSSFTSVTIFDNLMFL